MSGVIVIANNCETLMIWPKWKIELQKDQRPLLNIFTIEKPVFWMILMDVFTDCWSEVCLVKSISNWLKRAVYLKHFHGRKKWNGNIWYTYRMYEINVIRDDTIIEHLAKFQQNLSNPSMFFSQIWRMLPFYNCQDERGSITNFVYRKRVYRKKVHRNIWYRAVRNVIYIISCCIHYITVV